ncbi:MAG: hypothetical protein A2491_19725 [Bacteroidetes bacterium RIFOXYC12_FULL_35_7]|nr:MAG: hypothetical protein A2491_19725 [Bacteroidetes bacterium RIFOXYC12_FULL_35_7]
MHNTEETSVSEKIIVPVIHYKQSIASDIRKKMSLTENTDPKQVLRLQTGRLTETNKEDALSSQTTSRNNTAVYVLIIWLIGCMFFLIRFALNLLYIIKYIRNGRVNESDGLRIVRIKENIPAFSFMNYVFISDSAEKSSTFLKIILHEKIHASQKHSLDLLLIELILIFQWFNPIVWLYKSAIKRNHEFLADSGVVNNGIDINDYKYTLLDHLLVRNSIELTSNYSLNDLKARMTMLSKKKSGIHSSFRYAFILPLTAILFILFSFTVKIPESIKTNTFFASLFTPQQHKLNDVTLNSKQKIQSTVRKKTGESTNKLMKKTIKSYEEKEPNEDEDITPYFSRGLDYSLLTIRDGLAYIENDSIPYTGLIYEYYDSGEKGMVGAFINGVANDHWIFWYKNGQKKTEYKKKDGQINGSYLSWYKDGTLRINAWYIQGEINDLYKYWHENGMLKKESCFNDGVPYDSKVFDKYGFPSTML